MLFHSLTRPHTKFCGVLANFLECLGVLSTKNVRPAGLKQHRVILSIRNTTEHGGSEWVVLHFLEALAQTHINVEHQVNLLWSFHQPMLWRSNIWRLGCSLWDTSRVPRDVCPSPSLVLLDTCSHFTAPGDQLRVDSMASCGTSRPCLTPAPWDFRPPRRTTQKSREVKRLKGGLWPMRFRSKQTPFPSSLPAVDVLSKVRGFLETARELE